MERYLEFGFHSDHNGYRANVLRHATGQSVPIIITQSLLGSSVFGGNAKNFRTTLEHTTGKLNDETIRYSEQGFCNRLKTEIMKPIGQDFRTIRENGVVRRNELQATKSDWATPTCPKDDYQARLLAELRGRIAAMKPIQALDFVLRDFNGAVAVAEGGEANARAMGWQSDFYTRFMDDFAERNLANRLAGQYRLKPTANAILRDGPDLESANQAAREHMAAHRVAVEEISGIEAMLTSVVDFAAVTLGSDRDTAFDMLMAA